MIFLLQTYILDPVVIKRTESVTDDDDKQNYNIRPDLLEDDLKLSCCVLMLDTTLKQVNKIYFNFLFSNKIKNYPSDGTTWH